MPEYGRLWAVLSLVAVFVMPSAQAAEGWLDGKRARLQTLDKITARINTIDVPIGVATRVGTLELYVRSCAYRPPEAPPEHAALIEIRTIGEDGQAIATPVFKGWMFASSPAISGLEHPVYDITVLSCNN